MAHVIVCGLGRIGWPVLDYLRAAGWSVVAIDQEIRAEDPRLAGVRLIRGDLRDPANLREAGIERATGVMLLANDDLANLAGSLAVRRLNPQVRIIVRLFNENLLNKLKQAISNVVALSSSRIAAPLLASTALTGDLLASFETAHQSWQIITLTIEANSSLVGQTWQQVRARFPGVHRLNHLSCEIQQIALQAGDQLVLIGTVADLAKLREAAQGDEPFVVRWAGLVRRFLRTIWRTFWEIEWPVRYAALCLFSVMLIGSMVFWLSGVQRSWPKGLLYTLNIMVTSADLKASKDAAPWEEIFIGCLKLSGLLLTAAFTALMTNYLVRARLGGALAIRKIPEAGHIVMCGLGTVGIRVVEQLRALGAAVVVLEKVDGTRFLAAARQKGATVLLGDGTLLPNLERARTATARAFLAATSSDLANVEMALMARELNPKLRVVLRLDDGVLADSLRQTANIRYAIGLPQLIAPAFAAPLFGDLVLSLFWLQSTLHAVMEMEVEEQQTHLVGKSRGELQTELGMTLLPLSLESSDQPLKPKDRLLAILPISQIAELLARGKPAA